jgi:hypothetical protein
MNDGIACHLQGMENGGTQQSRSGLNQYPEQGLAAFSTVSDIPPCPDFKCDPLHPPLFYSVEARPSHLHP